MPSASAESIEDSIRNLFKALGDRAAFLAYAPTREIAFPIQFFDYDWENKPVTLDGLEAVNKYLDALVEEMARRKMTVVSRVTFARGRVRPSWDSPCMNSRRR